MTLYTLKGHAGIINVDENNNISYTKLYHDYSIDEINICNINFDNKILGCSYNEIAEVGFVFIITELFIIVFNLSSRVCQRIVYPLVIPSVTKYNNFLDCIFKKEFKPIRFYDDTEHFINDNSFILCVDDNENCLKLGSCGFKFEKENYSQEMSNILDRDFFYFDSFLKRDKVKFKGKLSKKLFLEKGIDIVVGITDDNLLVVRTKDVKTENIKYYKTLFPKFEGDNWGWYLIGNYLYIIYVDKNMPGISQSKNICLIF